MAKPDGRRFDRYNLRVFEDLRARSQRQTRDRRRCDRWIGDGVTLRPRCTRHDLRQERPAASGGRSIEQVHVQACGAGVARGLLQLRLVARREAEIHVPARNDAAVLAGEAGEILPDRMRPERQGKLRRVAPLKTQIAEVDGARGGAHLVLLDHGDRAPALAQEVGREATHEAAADNRHVDGCGGHVVPRK